MILNGSKGFDFSFGFGKGKKTAPQEGKEGQEPPRNPNHTLEYKTAEGVPMTEGQIVDMVTKEFEIRKKNRLPFELQWRLNIDFYIGNQFNRIDDVRGDIVEQQKMAYWESREVFNHVHTFINTRIAKLKKVKSTSKARPESSSSQDITKAKITNAVIASIERSDVANIWDEAIALAEYTGTAFYVAQFDPDKGPAIATYDDGGELKEGDNETTVASCFEFFPEDLFISSMKDQPTMIRAQITPTKAINDLYGVSVDPETVSGFGASFSDFSQGGAQAYSKSSKLTSQKRLNHALLMTYTALPNKEYPNGVLIIVARGKLCVCTELPYINGYSGERTHHYVAQKAIDVAGHFFGQSVIERLIPAQRAYNALKNRKLDFVYQVVFGARQIESNSMPDWQLKDIQENGLEPNSVVILNPGAKGFSVIETPQYPASLANEEENLLHEMTVLSGVSEISRVSGAPVGANSGVALQILAEQDDTRLSLTVENINQAKVELTKHWIRLYQQFITIERIAKVGDKSSKVDIQKWKGEDLTSEDIFIEASSLLSETISQRRQMVFDLLQRGVFNDPEKGTLSSAGRSKLFEMLELGNWESFDDDNTTKVHLERAGRENINVVNGTPITIKDYDDHMVHVMVHNKYRLSEAYEEVEIESPDLAMALATHIEEHLAQMQKIAMEQMQAQQAAQMQQATQNQGTPQ